MKTFLTEYRSVPDYILYAGENIQAKNWKEAEFLADEIGVEVIGELVETQFVNKKDYNFEP